MNMCFMCINIRLAFNLIDYFDQKSLVFVEHYQLYRLVLILFRIIYTFVHSIIRFDLLTDL